jgi:succinoglycan biosynthesis transport protein ExoP
MPSYVPMPTAYPMAPVAAPPPGWQHWQPAPQAYAPPMMHQHDPWAHMRGWANMPPSYAPQPWAPPQPQVVFIAVPQPMPTVQQLALPAIAEPTPVAQSVPAQQPTRPVDRWRDQDRFVDDSTDAAIEEIRRNLREFREAIEDFADDRTVYNQPRRRFGT